MNLEISGIIESHGYPWFYLPEEKCSWTIDLPPGITMMLEFPDFSLQGTFFILAKYDIVNEGTNVPRLKIYIFEEINFI